VTISHLFRALCAGAVVISTVAISPLSAAATSTTEYVIVERDGSVDVRTLTQAQAVKASIDPAVRIVQPNNAYQIDDITADIVTGLSVPTNAEAGDVIPGRYIVQFASNTASAVAATSLTSGVITTFSDAINGFVANLTNSEVASLQSNPNVVSIEADRIVTASADQLSPGWGLDRIDQRLLPLNQKYSYTTTGVGVTAYVVDSGINSTHTDFTGRIKSGFTAISDGNGTEDCNGHGTHVSGIMAGTKYGVAKSASIVPIRVLGCDGSGTVAGLISGLNWAITNHAAGVPAVANLSVGAAASASLNSAVASAVADGITVVVAAGNDNANACNYSPASAPSAITVGATTSNDTRSSFSNFGSCLDIFAPGSSISSAYKGSTTAVASMSGTSMASPFVAGIAAIYLESFASATPAAVTKAITDAASPNVVGSAGVDSPNKLAYSASFVAAPATVPSVPLSLTTTPSSQSVALAWALPASDGGSAITDYKIEYKLSNVTAWTVFARTASTTRTANITGLTNGTQYSFRVSAVNAVGTGTATTAVLATPVAPATLTSPLNLTGTVGRQSVALSWQQPSSIPVSAITDYIIESSVNAGTTWSTINDGVSANRTFTVTGLSAVAHSFRVKAVNSTGTSPASNTVVITPLALESPSAPRALAVYASFNGATLYWATPSSDGGSRITGYRTEYSTDNGTTWIPSDVAVTTRSKSYTNLVGGVLHKFRVFAINAVGTSVASSSVEGTPVAATVASEPRFFGGFLSGTSAYLSWTRPLMTGGSAITSYTTWQSTDNGATWSSTAVTNANVRNIRVNSLSYGVQYQFRVTASNAVGSSAPSSTLTLQLRGTGTPNPPSSIRATVSTTSITLVWSQVVAKAAPVTDYIVEFRTDNSSGWAILNDGVSTALTATLTKMTPDLPVSMRVKAVNSYGASPPSATVTVTPRSAATVPTAPLSVSATAGDTRVAVRWVTPASSGGSAITSYTATSTPGGFTCTTSSNACVVTELTNGTSYTFTVTATNIVGTSVASAPSAAVIPIASGSPTLTAASWGLDRTDQRSLPLDKQITRGGTGAGVSAYIIDTGVYATSAEFGSRVTSGFTAVSDGKGSGDCHSHGTHVAGTVAGSTYGLAPQATIIPVRVLDCNGSGSTAGIISGIEWIIQHHVAGVPAVANMSLGTMSGIDVAINDAVARAVADGITFVVAAGNWYSDACNYSPSSEASAITVGATDSTDAVASFSNSGSCVDIMAPGVHIISAAITSPNATSTKSGTSMAAPHVAGVVANMLGNAPTMTPTQVATQLLANATDATLTNLPSNTTNALLYQQPASANSFSLSAEVDSSALVSDITADDSSVVAYDEDPGLPEAPAQPLPPKANDPVTPNPVVTAPVETVATPTAPAPTPTAQSPSSQVSSVASAPPRTSAMTNISIGKITKVGKQLRVTVNAPKGSKVSLYRNGKLVGKGAKKVFMVPASKVKKQNFIAVISVAGAFVSSASVSLPVRSASLR
jgi:subtilisin family serine protease